MMKKFAIKLVLIAALITGASCEKLLDIQPSVEVSEEQLLENISGFQVVLNGVYRYMMSAPNGIGGVGIAGMQLYNLTGSPDMWVREIGNNYFNSSVFRSVRTESSGEPANKTWEYNYRLINNCNIILSKIDRFSDQPDIANPIKGQALAIRGWAYFNLVRYFQQTYSIAKSMSGVPIYLDRATAERPQADRSSVEEVYQQILSDLNGSISLLEGWSRPGKEFINSEVSHGILAQVYLTMRNWSEAANQAKIARSGYTLMTPAEFRDGFAKANREWMWGFKQTETCNIKESNIFARWNINGSRPAGASAFGDNTTRANASFVALFDSLDCRNQFFYVSAGALNSGWATNKLRDDKVNYYGDLIIMRAAEMYLIEAEALANLAGRQSEALVLLNELQSIRLVKTLTSTTNQEELLSAIWLERRKELYSEGLIFFDLLRLEKDLVKEGDASNFINIPAHSWQFIMQIPDNEINFKGISVQNPLTGVYSGS
jgi:starch-binding outer membrane protein, SusD/RagB family